MDIYTIKVKYQEREKLKQQIAENQGWYFIDFIGNIPAHRPYSFTLSNKPFVLLKDNSDRWICYLLPTSNQDDCLKLALFTAKEKQGGVWF